MASLPDQAVLDSLGVNRKNDGTLVSGVLAMAQRARGGAGGSFWGCLGLLAVLVLFFVGAFVVFIYLYTSTPLPV